MTDMRKDMNGLSLLVQEGLGRDPHAGDLFDSLLDALRGIDEVQRAAIESARAELQQVARDVLAEAVALAPYETGELAESGYMTEVKGDQILTVEVGFTAPQSVPVHERLDVYHEKSQAKFLEVAVDRAASQLRARIAASIHQGWRQR